ncbi:unnamed protein product [Fusarium graminearum]|nr:unnamed protein product [Fusarium graminearum]
MEPGRKPGTGGTVFYEWCGCWGLYWKVRTVSTGSDSKIPDMSGTMETTVSHCIPHYEPTVKTLQAPKSRTSTLERTWVSAVSRWIGAVWSPGDWLSSNAARYQDRRSGSRLVRREDASALFLVVQAKELEPRAKEVDNSLRQRRTIRNESRADIDDRASQKTAQSTHHEPIPASLSEGCERRDLLRREDRKRNEPAERSAD